MNVGWFKILLVFITFISAGCTIDAKLLEGVSGLVAEPSQENPAPVTPVLKNTFPIGGSKAFYTLPMSLHITSDGKLLMSSYQDLAMSVQKYDLATEKFEMGFGPYGNTTDIQIEAPERVIEDPTGRILVVERFQNRIKVFDSSGTYVTSIVGLGPGAGTFAAPTDVAFDKNNRMYVTELDNDRIQIFNADGTFNRYISGSGSAVGQINGPTSVDVDENLNIYIVDSLNKRVQIFKPDNTVVAIGTIGTNPGELFFPYKVRVNSQGEIFVSDREGGANGFEIIKYSSTGTVLAYSKGNPADPFNELYDFAIDEDDNLYVASTLDGTIQVLDKDLNYVKTLDKQESILGGVLGLTIDSSDNLYSTQGYLPGSAQYIYKFDSQGQQLGRFSEYGTNPGQLQYAVSSAIDDEGNIYTADMLANRVSKFDKDGQFIKFVGSASTGTGPGEFVSVGGVCYRSGVIYVADASRGDVQKFDDDGNYLGVVGAVAGPGKLTMPSVCYVDTNNNLYVADQGGNIFKYEANGTFAFSFAHPASYGIYVDSTGNIYSTDLMGSVVKKYDSGGNLLTSFGTPGFASGQFNGPTGIVGDSKGNIYVAEVFGKRIQKFSSLGIPLTE
ncbi:NHL repeat-containing protein [Bdellovibrio bacteriovorus]